MFEILASLLYIIYLHSGLVLLVSPFCFNTPYAFITSIPSVSWFSSITVLSLANFCHASSFLGMRGGILFFAYSLTIVFAIETFGLRTGLAFGNYEFTNELGFRLTETLPLNVLVLWACLLYPCLLLGRYITFAKSSTSNLLSGSISTSVVCALFLTGFDVVTEPMAIEYGHKVWTYCAANGSDTSLYIRRPDWIFHEQQSGPSFRGVPVQNFIGWFACGFVIYLPTVFLMSQQQQQQQSVIPSRRPPASSSGYHCTPFLAAVVGTQIFYAIHPCHPLFVRQAAATYVLITVMCLLIARGK